MAEEQVIQVTEGQAREEARKLARKIGDEEWKKGNTKYAIEAWEASDITAAELFEKAQKLLEAAGIAQERIGSRTFGNDSSIKIQKLLGWNNSVVIGVGQIGYYRAAAVACLKMIKRMSPEQPVA